MRQYAWLVVLLLVLAAGKASESPPSARGDFHLSIRSKFLEPGTTAGSKPLYLTRVKIGDKGALTARAYAWFTPVEIEATADLKTIKTRAFLHDPRMPEWDLWRHRHGYTLGLGRKYTWNTLTDKRIQLNLADAEFYDTYLIALYRMWTRRALHNRPAAEDILPEPKGETKAKLTLQYNETGLVDPVTGSFRIHLWHIPIDVSFTLVPSSSTHPADWWFRVREDSIFLKYDENAWRARHAYTKTETGYQWDKDFPGESSLNNADGERLDALLNRGLMYWADASLHIGLFELDQELKKAAELFRRGRYPSGP